MGKLQTCHPDNYKVYDANMVIDSIDIKYYKKNIL